MPLPLVAVNLSPIMAAGHRQTSGVCSRPDSGDTMSTKSSADIVLTSGATVFAAANRRTRGVLDGLWQPVLSVVVLVHLNVICA